jgi:hypothetical protein
MDIDDSVIDDVELMQNNSEDSSDESDSDYTLMYFLVGVPGMLTGVLHLELLFDSSLF